jgi:Cu(I)/Ag(I) efflux system membrane fusion protein
MRHLWIVALTGLLAAATAACRQSGTAAARSAGDTGMAGMAMPASARAAADTAPAARIAVGATERRRLGIVVVTAELRELARDLRLVGRVTPAETAQRTVTSRIDGFVERLYVDFTGRAVRRGEPLLDIYSPMLVSAQQELLLAVRLRAALGENLASVAARNADSLVAASRRRLQYWEISDDQIAELERSGTVRRTLTLRAPVDGVVLQKNVIQGQSVMAGAALFQIADLSTVWLEADVFENDIGLMRVDQRAEVTFDAYPGQPFSGAVTYVYPTVDPASRTGRVRIELPNAGGRIRPGLFGTARFRAPLGGRGVVVPRQAALVTGDRQLVFVEDSLGRFVPRRVTLGAESDSLVQVLSGLRAGERVVATSAFLLDAESNLGAAMAGMAGMDMGPAAGGRGAAAPTPTAPAHQKH